MTRIGLRVQGYAVLAVLCSLLAAGRSEAAVVNLWTYAPPEGFVDAGVLMPVKEEPKQVRVVTDARWQTLQSVREKMAQLLEKLQAQ